MLIMLTLNYPRQQRKKVQTSKRREEKRKGVGYLLL